MSSSREADVDGTQRRIVVRFYFDILKDYSNLYEFVPHNAMVMYDAFVVDFASSPRAFSAACFALAQKTLDVQVISIPDMVELFGTTGAEIVRVENDVFARLAAAPLPLMPETSLLELLRRDPTLDRANVVRFFNLALFEDYPNEVRVLAAVRAFLTWTSSASDDGASDDGANASVIECADRLVHLASDQLGPVFADSPLLAST